MLAVERVKIQFGNGEIQLDATIQKLIQTAMRVLNNRLYIYLLCETNKDNLRK